MDDEMDQHCPNASVPGSLLCTWFLLVLKGEKVECCKLHYNIPVPTNFNSKFTDLKTANFVSFWNFNVQSIFIGNSNQLKWKKTPNDVDLMKNVWWPWSRWMSLDQNKSDLPVARPFYSASPSCQTQTSEIENRIKKIVGSSSKFKFWTSFFLLCMLENWSFAGASIKWLVQLMNMNLLFFWEKKIVRQMKANVRWLVYFCMYVKASCILHLHKHLSAMHDSYSINMIATHVCLWVHFYFRKKNPMNLSFSLSPLSLSFPR